MHQRPLGDVVPFYRQDIFDANGWTPPTNAEELMDLCREITSPRNRVWACEDLKWLAFKMYGVLPGTKPLDWMRGDNGRLVNRVETDEFLEALEWTRGLYQAGVVHPDAVAATGDTGVRVTSGESLMTVTGEGWWYGTVAEQRATNPDFRLNAFDFFAPDGGEPHLWGRNGASIFGFINRDLPEDRIREALEIANYCAAPYGTVEQRLQVYGIEGTHYTLEDGLPVRTEQGNVEVVPATYTFICSPETFVAHPDLPVVVENLTAWQRRNIAFVHDPLFVGRQVQEPARLANLADAFEDLEDDVVRGRQSIGDMRNAVAEWRRNGGDELRDFYQGLLDEEGSTAS
jgi:putative aldouronate transport system substrate-binding protein